MSYSIYNSMMPGARHLNPRASGLMVFGGGGGNASATSKPVTPTTFTSSYPELEGVTYNTEEEKTAAEAQIDEQRAAKAAEEERQAKAKELADARSELTASTIKDPTSMVTEAEGAKMNVEDNQFVAEGTGQLTGDTPSYTAQEATAGQAEMAAKFDPAQVTAATSQPKVDQALQGVEAAQGQVSQGAQAQAQTADPTQLSQLGMQAPQIAEAQRVAPVPPRQVQPGEMISGSAVDMAEVEAATDIQAAQADPSRAAMVQGQMADLMQQFEGDEPPAWAAGAMRAATAKMAARGLAASSMAGQAIVQAAMESALPIAMADAQTVAKFESQNLSNRQQAAMLGAEQRAKFLGQKFDQNFQTRVQNAARIADIANMNFTAEQQVALENARLAQSVDLANLDSSKAKVLADAAAMTQMELANLNNRQQAAVQNAQAFLQMDMANLSNRQQTAMFKAQSQIQSIFNDQAAENAARQFNAASENQVNQFFANMETQVSQFNASQQTAVSQFNAGEVNAASRFEAEMENQRQQFNANNALVVAQANAQWRQNIATSEFQSQHQANMQNAQLATNATMATMDQIWQRERDIMDFAFRQSESEADRHMTLLMHDRELAEQERVRKAEEGNYAAAFFMDLLVGGV